MKSSAYPLFYRQLPYMNCPPFLKENLEPHPSIIFQKSQLPLQIKPPLHTMAPQSNFAMTPPISIQLS